MSDPAVATPAPALPRRRGRTALVTASIVGAVLVVVGVSLALRVNRPTQYTGTALLGKRVPDLELPTLEGRSVALRGLAGRAVIVNFWNTWCIPCREEEPALRDFYARHQSDPDFAMVGIVRDDSESAVRTWVRDHQTAWTVAFDPGARAAIDFGTSGQPETYAISPDGVVVGRQLGRAAPKDLEALLARARGTG